MSDFGQFVLILFDSVTKTFWDKNKDGNETMKISIATVYELQL